MAVLLQDNYTLRSPHGHCFIRLNVKSSDLFSKNWCELIFQDRNKDYGAYRLRAGAGRRYRLALTVIVAGLMLGVGIPAGLSLYARYRLLQGLENAQADLKKLQQLNERQGFEIKRISAGRRAPAVSTIKGATEQPPEIIEVTKEDIIIGVNGPETFTAVDVHDFEDADTLHNPDRTDLPVEGPQLAAVQVVEEMPQFPGGIKTLMQWLDENVPYPRSCIDQKVKGDMEVSFLVDERGYVREPEITKKLHPELDNVVMSAMRRMPRWQPGKKGSHIAIVRVSIPLHFEIN